MDELDRIPDNSIDMVLTDPPYFIPTNSSMQRKETATRNLEDTSILNTYFKLLFKKMAIKSKSTSVWYVFCDGQSYPIFYNTLLPLCKAVRPLIWNKKTSINGYTWRHQHELIAFVTFKDYKKINTGDGDIIDCRAVPKKDKIHPAQKPVELLTKLLSKHPDVETVLDPFAGSGSTLVSAKRCGKRYIGIELNEHFVDICKSRLRASLLKSD